MDILGAELGTELGCSVGGSATIAPGNPRSASIPTISPDRVCFSTKFDAAVVFAAAGGAVILDFTLKHFLPTIEVVASKVQPWGIAVTSISTSFSGRNLPRSSTAS